MYRYRFDPELTTANLDGPQVDSSAKNWLTAKSWSRASDKHVEDFKKDAKEAFRWFQRAARLDDPTALTACGVAYCIGLGVEKDAPRGLVMLGQAAALGSEHACYLLGWAHRYGRYSLKQDEQEATRWFAKMASCEIKNSRDEYREAAAWLREHPASS